MLQNERFERFLNGLSKKTAQKPLNWGTLRGVRWGGGGFTLVGVFVWDLDPGRPLKNRSNFA